MANRIFSKENKKDYILLTCRIILTIASIPRAIKDWYNERKQKSYWTPERQLENLRRIVQQDRRWLASDKVADALTTRYLSALEHDWYRREEKDIRNLREELGLEPDYSKERKMSMHKIPLTSTEEDGLRAHGLAIGTPSQLSDVFRQGVAWGKRSCC